MKVKIKKDEIIKTYNVINCWEDVNLDTWSELVEMKTDTKSEEAINTIKILSNIPKEVVKQLALEDVSAILKKIAIWQSKANTELVKRMTIDGIEYGFHPCLDNITLGEYADIETLIKDDLNAALPDLMAILFRPITETENDCYSIEAYDGDIGVRREIMRKMNGQQVQNALVFFWTLGKKSLIIMQSYSTEQTTEIISKTLAKTSALDGGGLESYID